MKWFIARYRFIRKRNEITFFRGDEEKDCYATFFWRDIIIIGTKENLFSREGNIQNETFRRKKKENRLQYT